MQPWSKHGVVTWVVLAAFGASRPSLQGVVAAPQIRTVDVVAHVADATCPEGWSVPSACAEYSPFNLDADCCAKPTVAFCAPGFVYSQGKVGCGKGHTGGEVTTCCAVAQQDAGANSLDSSTASHSVAASVSVSRPVEAPEPVVRTPSGMTTAFYAAPTPPPPEPAPAPAIAASAPPGLSSPADPLADCLEIPRALCVTSSDGAQSVVVSAPKAPKELVLWYQFDKSLPVDDSGGRNHLLDADGALSQVPIGPGVLGRGGSASFDGRVRRVVRGPATLRTEAFTVTMWLYLREDSVGSWRTIFSKGSDPERLAPALLMKPDERRLHVRVSHAGSEGTSLDGSGLFPLRRWTHISVVCTGSVLRLYINGLKDGEVILENSPTSSGEDDLHLGRDPWRAGTKAFLDDFRWYSRALLPAEIKALTLPSMIGTGIDFVRLGCTSCKYTEAVRSCGSRSHICSAQELYSGGLHIARVMGWLAASPEVWVHEGSEQDEEHFSNIQKLGLCCAN